MGYVGGKVLLVLVAGGNTCVVVSRSYSGHGWS